MGVMDYRVAGATGVSWVASLEEGKPGPKGLRVLASALWARWLSGIACILGGGGEKVSRMHGN